MLAVIGPFEDGIQEDLGSVGEVDTMRRHIGFPLALVPFEAIGHG